MRITVKQLKQLIREAVEETMEGSWHDESGAGEVEKFLAKKGGLAGLEQKGQEMEALEMEPGAQEAFAKLDALRNKRSHAKDDRDYEAAMHYGEEFVKLAREIVAKFPKAAKKRSGSLVL